jgi:ATP-dependent DNA helicase RecG
MNRKCPTHAGALLFGVDPLRWLPGAYIQFARFGGPELSDDALADKELSGDLLNLLRQLDSFVQTQIEERTIADTALRERRVADYPVVAIREFLMNAIMHRSYDSTAPIRLYWFSDRVEIQNPGGLYGEATRENFPMQNAYRNPIVAEAMKTLGYVNKFGRGVLRAQRALREAGNGEATFTFEDTYVLVQIPRRP